MKNPFSKEN